MTTLAAIQGEGWAVIGYDSRVTEENRLYLLPKDNPKLVKNGPYFLGAAGDMRAINLMAHSFKPPIPTNNEVGEKLDKFITSKFIPELKSCFEENGYGKEGEQDSYIMVVVNGTIYELGSNYEWARDSRGIYALGSGASYALGAMFSELSTKKRTLTVARAIVKNSVQIATQLDPGTGEPVNTVVQKHEVK
jgi:ATP-dependent protease HslVU (ClpYQ) peptidase subunit